MFKKNDQSTKTLDSFPPEKTDYSYEVKFTLSTSNTKKIREVVAVRSRDSMSERNKLREKLSIDAKLERVADVVHITNANIDSPVVKVLAVVSKLNNKKIVVAGNEFATQELLDGAAQDVEATGKSPKKSELQNFQEVKPVDGNSSRAVFIGGAVDPSNKDRSNVVAPEVDAKITVLDESKELKDQKPFNAVPDKSFGLGGVIFKGRPIQVFDEQSKQTPVTGGEVFGAVIFATVPSVFNQSLVVNYSGNKFTVKYSREISSIEYKKRPDDIALISRLFLLSTISKLKEEMRDCLKELTEKFEKVKQIDINNIQQNSNQNLSKPNASKKIKDSNNKLIIIFVRFLRLTLYKTKVKFNEIKSATSDLSKKINNSFIRKTLKEKKIAVGEFFLALRPSKIKVKFDKSKSGMLVNLLGAQDSVN